MFKNIFSAPSKSQILQKQNLITICVFLNNISIIITNNNSNTYKWKNQNK